MTFALMALLRLRTINQLPFHAPGEFGLILGMDRAPEVKTLRRKLAELAERQVAADFSAALTWHWTHEAPELLGFLYVDGHVRPYNGRTHELPKAHVPRRRLCMPATTDYWVNDAFADPLFFVSAQILPEVRDLVGEARRVTLVMDRECWSPNRFESWSQSGFDILTYRKGAYADWPAEEFTTYVAREKARPSTSYRLADRALELTNGFKVREVRCLTENGHQTSIVTTRWDLPILEVAERMFSRWRQENFFRYLRSRYALDALDAYTTVPDDPDRDVPNPARPAAKRHADELADAIDAAQADLERHRAAGVPACARDAHQGLAAELDTARTALEERSAAAKATPARAPISQVRPDSRRLDPERKRIHDAVRMATYNAESALARLLAAHYPRADDEACTLLAEIFTAPADLQVVGDELHVTIHPLSAPRRTRALAGLCADLTATRTTYPGTDLTLVYTAKPR
jgi:hypothetical protein